MEDPGAPRQARPAGRHRPRKWYLAPAVRRQVVTIAASAVVVALAAGVVLTMLPDHAATVLASKCQPRGCPQVILLTPRTVVPVAISASAAPRLTPGSTISIRATTPCCTSFYIQHDDSDNRVVITRITPGSSAGAKADATWIVRAGLADGSCVSFESANDRGYYLRHFDFELYLDQDDGSAQLAQDATFCPRPGNSGQGYSFQSVNYPDKYIRHYNYVVYIASDGGSNPWDNPALWPDDTTWLVTQPWG